MRLYITHQSALAYWLGPYVHRRDAWGPHKALPSGSLAGHTLHLDDFERMGVAARPLHLAVARAEQRSRQVGCVCHLMSGAIPRGAFERLKNDIWVASPELTFCQMAPNLTFCELVKLGYELCSRFRINEFTEDVDTREPLTDAHCLRDFCARFTGNGAKAARAAAQYVCANTESPMEIALAMLLTLPRMYGGYGLPQAAPNHEIRIAPRHGRRSELVYRGDLVWTKQRVIVEYDSELHHRAPRKLTEDAVRRNNLQDAGWRVVTVTWEQLRTPSQTDALAGQLARALKVHNSYTAAQAAPRRIELRKLLFPWAFPGFEGF